jgi:plastocyanin
MVAQSFFLSSLLLATGAMAQSNTQSGSSSSASGMAGPDGNLVSVQVVQVSDMNATLKYYPEDIKAEPGSMVQFQFYPKVSHPWHFAMRNRLTFGEDPHRHTIHL